MSYPLFGGELGGLASTMPSDLDPALARLGIGAVGNVALAGTIRTELLNGYRTLTHTPGRCTGCGSCIAVCPQRVCEADADGRAVLAHREACTACTACLVQWPCSTDLSPAEGLPDCTPGEVIPALDCTSDAQCGPGGKCLLVPAHGRCRKAALSKNVGCTSHADCALVFGAGVCKAGVCKATASNLVPCTTDADCQSTGYAPDGVCALLPQVGRCTDGCPGACGLDDDQDGFSDGTDPDVVSLAYRLLSNGRDDDADCVADSNHDGIEGTLSPGARAFTPAGTIRTPGHRVLRHGRRRRQTLTSDPRRATSGGTAQNRAPACRAEGP